MGRYLVYGITWSLIFFILLGCEQKPKRPKSASKPAETIVFPEVTVGALDKQLAEKGSKIFDSKCAVCHKISERYVGPALKGVTTRRTPQWIMSMMLQPEKMTQLDPTARQLLGEYMTQMANQNLTPEEARTVLEYLRSVEEVPEKK